MSTPAQPIQLVPPPTLNDTANGVVYKDSFLRLKLSGLPSEIEKLSERYE